MKYTVTFIPPTFVDDVVEIQADSEKEAVKTFYSQYDSQCVIVSADKYDADEEERKRERSAEEFIRTWGVEVIFPYKKNDLWVFDDHATGLKEEPFFTPGAAEMIGSLVARIEPDEQRFAVYLCAKPFTGYCTRLDHIREEHGGHWYLVARTESSGWLCPTIIRRFKNVPEFLFCSAKPVRAAVERERHGNYTINFIPPPFERDAVEIRANSKEEAIEQFYNTHDGLCVIISTQGKSTKGQRRAPKKTKA